MYRLALMILLSVLGTGGLGGRASAGGAAGPAISGLVSFRAADGLSVFAQYVPGPADGPLLLLFHMADSNKSEYDDIAPRLNRAGFGTLAVDARSGHATYAGDHRNLTAEGYERRAGTTAGFSEAYPDLVAALKWARRVRPARPVLVLGSSYSANLVFKLAADFPEQVGAVLSFSPTPDQEVLNAASRLAMPVFLTSAGNGREISDARAIFQVIRSPQHTQYVPTAGPHGAAALSTIGNGDSQGYWQALLAFLKPLRSSASKGPVAGGGQ